MKKTFKEFMEQTSVTGDGSKLSPRHLPGGPNSQFNKDGTPKGNPKDTAIMRMSGNPLKVKAGDIVDKVKTKIKDVMNRPIMKPNIDAETYRNMKGGRSTNKDGVKFDIRYP